MKEGKLFTEKPNIWFPDEVIGSAKRSEGIEVKNKDGVVFAIKFENLPAELSFLEGQSLKVKGTGPVIRLAISFASEDWSSEFQGKTYSIAKGQKDFRAFA